MEKKEAMKILKDFHDKSALFSIRTALDTIIPKLKEKGNEEEEIRELLVDYFKEIKKQQGEFGANSFWGIPTDSIIAWLERRSEQVFTNSTKTFKNEDERIRNFIANELACIRATDEKGSDRYEELTKAIDWLERQSSQKTIDKTKSFNEYEELTDFERTLTNICIGWIGKELGWKQYIKDNADILLKIAIEMFNSMEDALFEQEPTWSEEDENHIIGITQTISDAIKNNVISHKTGNIQISWLKEQLIKSKRNNTMNKEIKEIEIPFGAKDSELIEVSYHIPDGFHAEIKGNKVIIKKDEQK